jgi:hypothetical protein
MLDQPISAVAQVVRDVVGIAAIPAMDAGGWCVLCCVLLHRNQPWRLLLTHVKHAQNSSRDQCLDVASSPVSLWPAIQHNVAKRLRLPDNQTASGAGVPVVRVSLAHFGLLCSVCSPGVVGGMIVLPFHGKSIDALPPSAYLPWFTMLAPFALICQFKWLRVPWGKFRQR